MYLACALDTVVNGYRSVRISCYARDIISFILAYVPIIVDRFQAHNSLSWVNMMGGSRFNWDRAVSINPARHLLPLTVQIYA